MKHVPVKESISKLYSNKSKDFVKVVNVSFCAKSGAELYLFRRCAWRGLKRGLYTYKNSERTKQVVTRGCYFSLEKNEFMNIYHEVSQEEIDDYCGDIKNIE